MFEEIGDGVRRVDGDGIFRGADLQARREKGLKRGDDVGRGQRRAIGEFHTGPEFELPVAHAGVMGPFGGESGLKPAVIVEGKQAVVDEDGELFVLSGGRGTRFPLSRVQRDGGGAKDDAQGSAVTRALGGLRGRCPKRDDGKNASHHN